jgi:hypothetical protein
MVVLGNNKSYQMYCIAALGKYKVLFTITELLSEKRLIKERTNLQFGSSKVSKHI